MDYTSSLETLEGFWMALSWCFEHQVNAWAILYPLVKLSNPYSSTLETLESFWNPLSMFSEHHVGAWAILHSFFKVSNP